MTISLSIDSIISTALAQTAIRHCMDGNRPPVPNHDNRPALSRLARGAFGHVCVALVPLIRRCDPPGADDCDNCSDLMQFDIDDSHSLSGIGLRYLAEHAIESYLLSELYAGTDSETADRYNEQFTLALDKLRVTAACMEWSGAAITPYP